MKSLSIICIFLLCPAFVFSGEKDILLGENFQKKTFKTPLREVAIIVTDDGFYPDNISAFEGERLRFFITSTSKKSQCFILQKHEVFVSAEKGLVGEAQVLLENAGHFKFYCPSSKFQGYLTVMERFENEKAQKRSVAREGGPSKRGYWLPRDYD